MSYRSLKKILGEKNLEQKCLVLFSVALLVLISCGFYFVERKAENLVIQTTNGKGRDLSRTVLYDIHWDHWEDDPKLKRLRENLAQDLLSVRIERNVLSTDFPSGTEPWSDNVVLNPSSFEVEIVNGLKRRHREQLIEEGERRTAQESTEKSDPLAAGKPRAVRELDPVFDTLITKRPDNYEYDYNYYQAVQWKQSCVACHEGFYGRHAIAAGDQPLVAGSELPFFVVKVTLPYDETGNAINWTRAILATVGIVTIVVAIAALWVIVRYVVVKPLNHLRDVSDAVAKGHIEQRAEINTGDEFEELATSFNKMLRHLVDTQAEIRNINETLDAKVDELAQLNMRLYDMNRMKSEFLAGMSHELRTPLNSIIGFSEVLQGIESLTDKQRRYVQNIQKSGRQLLDMINEILDLAKLEAGRMELRLSEFQIDRVISAQCDMVRPLAEEKNLDLVVNVPGDLPPLYQDQAKIQQILTNLLSNAIKFTPEGGRITVSARSTPQGMIELTVADTGVGIAESDREIIFEKFRQGAMVLGRDALTREFSGTGLGLSIVKELCKRMGGEVTVESELGKGSTFRALLPWMVVQAGKQPTSLQTRLDDLTRPNRSEFGEASGPDVEAAGVLK
jgi:two-component system, NarL family, sensor histidine kinase BarA